MEVTEEKLAVMLLDQKFRGTLDQGRGCLEIFPPLKDDAILDGAVAVMKNLEKVVDVLFDRVQKIAAGAHLEGVFLAGAVITDGERAGATVDGGAGGGLGGRRWDRMEAFAVDVVGANVIEQPTHALVGAVRGGRRRHVVGGRGERERRGRVWQYQRFSPLKMFWSQNGCNPHFV